MTQLHYGPARTETDLRQILALQRANLPDHLTAGEQAEQGFVSVQHDLELLRRMNTPFAHSVARDGEEVVAYALVMEPRFRSEIAMLRSLFDRADRQHFRGRALADIPYFVMGQVCIAKAYRGQGVFDALYTDLCQRLSGNFDLVVTLIAGRNSRSLRAHERVGFRELERYAGDSGEEWVLVARPC